MEANWPLIWTAVSAMGQVIATILAIGALIYSVMTFRQSALIAHYSTLDDMYADLLRLAIEKPHLRMRNATRTLGQQQEYEIYAHLAWCFVENVYDRSLLDSNLMKTWMSAVEIETRLHREWLERPENAYMFKNEFRSFIARSFPRQEIIQTVTGTDSEA